MVDYGHATNSADSSRRNHFPRVQLSERLRMDFRQGWRLRGLRTRLVRDVGPQADADLGYLVMPNHWHLVLWPEHDGELASFMQRLTTTHVRRGICIARLWVAGISTREPTNPFRSKPTSTC